MGLLSTTNGSIIIDDTDKNSSNSRQSKSLVNSLLTPSNELTKRDLKEGFYAFVDESETDDTSNNIDDFNRQDKICVNYIKKFISGATDTKDECEVSTNDFDLS